MVEKRSEWILLGGILVEPSLKARFDKWLKDDGTDFNNYSEFIRDMMRRAVDGLSNESIMSLIEGRMQLHLRSDHGIPTRQ